MTADRPSLSIIVATSGRSTLSRTLASIAQQLVSGDELIVVRDASGDSGDAARTDAMLRAKGTHLAFIDDDDAYAPGALEAMRRFARAHPNRIGIFKLRYPVGTTCWREGEPHLQYGNVSTQNVLVPNLRDRLGCWRESARPSGEGTYAGDFVFIKETVELQGEPIFVDEVTVLYRPENRLKRLWTRGRYRLALGAKLRAAAKRLRTAP